MCKFLCWPNLDFTHNQAVGLRYVLWAAERNWPFSFHPCCAAWGGNRGGRGVGNEGVKVNLGKRKVFLQFCLCFSPSKSILISKKFNSFFQVKSVLHLTEIGKRSTCLYPDLQVFYILSPCPVEERKWESSQVGIWQLAKVNTPQSVTEE